MSAGLLLDEASSPSAWGVQGWPWGGSAQHPQWPGEGWWWVGRQAARQTAGAAAGGSGVWVAVWRLGPWGSSDAVAPPAHQQPVSSA